MKIELSGGIGNQLFQYSLGNFLKRKCGKEVTFISAPLGKRETSHNSDLKDFHFTTSLTILNRNQFADFYSRVDRYLVHRSTNYKEMMEWCFGHYTQMGIGYDERILQLQRLRSIRGYFQSYLYAEEIRPELISQFELIAPSDSFLKYAEEAKFVKPIVVHLRRGDYTQLTTSVGILGAEYYFNGIKALTESGSRKQIWIFSDDYKAGLVLATQLEEMGYRDIRVANELTDSETLKLMSLGSGIVIANSTFSWWSAFLGNYEGHVVAPKEWYKALPDPSSLLPKNWKLITSSWE